MTRIGIGNFQGVETGVRQLRRNLPLETETKEVNGKKIRLPTIPEMLRTKAWMIISRNATWGYIDFIALSKRKGLEKTVDVFKDFDLYYSDLIRGQKASPIVQLIRQLAKPKPGDLDQIDLSGYKGLEPPYDSWRNIENACGELSVALADTLVRIR